MQTLKRQGGGAGIRAQRGVSTPWLIVNEVWGKRMVCARQSYRLYKLVYHKGCFFFAYKLEINPNRVAHKDCNYGYNFYFLNMSTVWYEYTFFVLRVCCCCL